MRVEISLDRIAAYQLLLALRYWRRLCEEHDLDLPPDLKRLACIAEDVHVGRRTEADSPRRDGDTGTNGYLPDQPFFSRREVADLIGRNERTVRRWIAGGKLAVTPLGVPRGELKRLAQERRGQHS